MCDIGRSGPVMGGPRQRGSECLAATPPRRACQSAVLHRSCSDEPTATMSAAQGDHAPATFLMPKLREDMDARPAVQQGLPRVEKATHALVPDNLDVRAAHGADDDGVTLIVARKIDVVVEVLAADARGVIIVHGKGLALHGEGLVRREEPGQGEETSHSE